MPLKPKTLCHLFGAFVGSIFGYASEIWGYTKSKEIERIHLKFCKRRLNVKLSCSNASVYGELGRYPLYVSRYVRMVKYWCKHLLMFKTVQTLFYLFLSFFVFVFVRYEAIVCLYVYNHVL